MAVHVEDHPLDYFDFEGVIPAGEYGGGDVIVWDWGTWELADGDDPLAGRRGRRPALRPPRREAARPVRAACAAARRAARSSGCCSTSTTTHAVAGWDPEDHPRSVKSGRTNDEVKAAPAATLVEHALVGRRRRPTSSPRSTRCRQGGGQWTLGEHTLKLTNLDKVLFPAQRPHRAVTKRDLIRHYADDRPGDAAVPRRPAGQPAPLPGRHRQAGLLAQGRARRTRPTGSRRWRNDDADPGETEVYSCSTRPPRWRGRPTSAPSSCTRGRRRSTHPHQPTWAMIDIDPGDDEQLRRRRSCSPGCTAPRSTPRRRGVPEGHRQARHPDLGPGRRRLHVRRHPGVGRAAVADRSATPCPRWSAGSGRSRQAQGAGPGSTTPRTRSTRPSSRRSARARARRAGVGADHAGTSSTIPTCGPDRWTIDNIGERLAGDGDPLAPLIGLQQRLPSI